MTKQAQATGEQAVSDHDKMTPKRSIDALQTLFSEWTRLGHLKSLDEFFDGAATLEQEHAELQITYRTNLGALMRMENTLARQNSEHKQELDKQRKSVAGLADTVSKLEKELQAERKKLIDNQSYTKSQEQKIEKMILGLKELDIVKQQLDNTEHQKKSIETELTTTRHALDAKNKELTQASDNLGIFCSFVIRLTSLRESRVKADTCESLQAMFNESFYFMQKWFHRDLPDSCLTEAKLWDGIRTHPAIHRAIPLAPLNSESAKGMRVAAGLLIFSHSIAKHIMRSIYVMQDDAADGEMADLRRLKPDMATYTRAVLLKALPGRQLEGRNEAVSIVVKDAGSNLAPWVAEDQLSAFHSDLEIMTRKMADRWTQVQMLEENISPIFESSYLDDWKPLPAQHGGPQTPPSSPTSTKQKQKQKRDSVVQKQHLDEDTVVVNVWPSLVIAGMKEDTDALLCRGFGLTRSQITEAEDEVSRRTARKAVRSLAPTGVKKRRDSAIAFITKDTNSPSPTE